MPLDGLPGPAGGDPHALVVVARRPARRESVAEPEAVLGRERIRDVREGGGSLVGGDDEVRVVAIDADDVGRRHDLPGRQRVGHVEQSSDEQPVALDDFVAQGVALGRRALDHEPALRARRDDDGVLDGLRLQQAENLGAKVLTPVRPANPAPGDGAAAQVDAFHARRVDEDLEHRPRVRQVGDPGRVELEGEIRLRRSVGAVLEVVRAQHRLDHAQEPAQDPVLVEARHRVEPGLDLPRELRRLLTAGPPDRSEA